MIRTPQLVFRVDCQCGEYVYKFSSYHAAILERDRLRVVGLQEAEDACECRGSAWSVGWYVEWLPDPIATVRQVHPHAAHAGAATSSSAVASISQNAGNSCGATRPPSRNATAPMRPSRAVRTARPAMRSSQATAESRRSVVFNRAS
jgi:hypothetical protein